MYTVIIFNYPLLAQPDMCEKLLAKVQLQFTITLYISFGWHLIVIDSTRSIFQNIRISFSKYPQQPWYSGYLWNRINGSEEVEHDSRPINLSKNCRVPRPLSIFDEGYIRQLMEPQV